VSARRAGRPPQLCVYLHNEVGRHGVPTRQSLERWIGAALAGRRRGWTEVNVALVGAARGRVLNRTFRAKDYATNVLSFPYPADGPGGLLGDLVLCVPVVAREALAQGKPLRDHYAHLTVHGTLHLLGYDHARAAEAAAMERIEVQVLDSLGITDPYR
jgi:probable rRNA maturation factor